MAQIPEDISSSNSKLVSAPLWALKLGGDIEQNYAGGGNAVETLYARIQEYGITLKRESFVSYIGPLAKAGHIKLLRKGRAIFAIRLLVSESQMPMNPFGLQRALPVTSHADIVPASDAQIPAHIEGDWREWSITDRLSLMQAVAESIRLDHETFKQGVANSL